METSPRSRAELLACYEQPLPDLLYRAATVHRAHHDPRAVQLSTLANIKQGGCPEDCGYCPQAARYHTGVDATPLLDADDVRARAHAARAGGSTRFCMGAAWRDVPDDARFAQVCDLVREVAALGLEVCCTLGMLTDAQAVALRAAGCHYYNHNLDTSPEFYGAIITTRTYQDRLDTLARVRAAGLAVCCGGILGLGESRADRVGLLAELVAMEPPPESVPINALVRVEGTPLADAPPVAPLEMVRMVATTRCALPRAQVRLSAGRRAMSDELQALCFLAGANSVFTGEKLLTTPNPDHDADRRLLATLGMYPEAAPTSAGAGR